MLLLFLVGSDVLIRNTDGTETFYREFLVYAETFCLDFFPYMLYLVYANAWGYGVWQASSGIGAWPCPKMIFEYRKLKALQKNGGDINDNH